MTPCSPSSPARRAPRAPLYHRLATGIAADPELAGLLLSAPPMQRQPVLLFACVHDLLLAGRPDEGARPLLPEPRRRARRRRSDAGVPGLRRRPRRRAGRAARHAQHADERDRALRRCCCRRSGIVAAEVGPLAHLDVGASAGLNLLLDRYQLPLRAGRRAGRSVDASR